MIFRRIWLRLLYARIRRIDRKQNRLSKAKTDAMRFAAGHRMKTAAAETRETEE